MNRNRSLVLTAMIIGGLWLTAPAAIQAAALEQAVFYVQ